jgi:hypothetical protein
MREPPQWAVASSREVLHQKISAIRAPISLWIALRTGRPDDHNHVRRSVIAAAGLLADAP